MCNSPKSLLLVLLLLAACRQQPVPVIPAYSFPGTNTPPDTILKAAKKLDSLAVNGSRQDKALAAVYWGIYHDNKGEFYMSKKVLLAGQLQLAGIKDTVLEGKIYKCLGNATKDLGDYPEALRLYSKALTYYPNDSAEQAGIHANIGQIFQMKDDPEQAIRSLQHSLELSGNNKDNNGYLVALHTLANVYGMAGKIDSALLLDAEGLEIAQRNGLRSSESPFLDNKAHCFVEKGQMDSARFYFRKSMAIDQMRGDKKQMSDSWMSLGVVARMEGNLEQSVQFLKYSMAQADTAGYRNGVMLGWKYLSETYAQMGNFKAALDAHTQFSDLKDSLLNAKKEVAISEWKAIYETGRKEEQLRIQGLKLQRKNTVIGFGSVSMAFLFSAVYFANRRAKLRKEKRYQEELFAHDQEAALKILIAEETERRRIAADLHDGVGQTLTAAWLNLQAVQPLMETLDEDDAKLLRTATQMVGDSCAEVRQISHNMMPTVLFQKGLLAALEEMVSRINEKQLRVSLSADDYNPETDKTVELVLYRIIQECINNTVRHSKATELFLSIHQEEGQLAVLIEDNGLGMRQPLKEQEGIGLQNIKSRVQYLRGSVEWHPVNPDNSGTIVEIYIPLSV